MSIVDMWNLKFEVKAKYPYSTYIVDTEDEVRELIQWERKVHGVGCHVRVVGAETMYFPPNDAADPWPTEWPR